MIRVDWSDLHGRGLFAIRTIWPGTIIGTWETLTIDASDGLPDPLDRYVFDSDDPDTAILALGPVSLLNHAHPANCEVELLDRVDGPDVQLRATRKIRRGAELTLDYGEAHDLD